jgi:hypothetical protein
MGALFRARQLKVSKGGKDYATATLRTVDDAEVIYWSIVAFGSAAEELARLSVGDAISAKAS